MQQVILILVVIFGLFAREAQAYELGLGAGRMRGCLARITDQEAVCAMGPALSFSLGLNMWGSSYRPKDHESLSKGGSVAGNSYDNGHWNTGLNLGLQVNRWEDLVIVIALALFMTSVGYALLYPFSSRMDIGLIGRSGWQQQSGADLELWRNELGFYLRAYLSQHFPLYIYGSGIFSYQSLSIQGQNENHQVFVKGVGLGLMSPVGGGPYFHGIWERSTLLDPNPVDLIEDAGKVKIFKNSVSEILDGSYLELGYLWYL